MANQVEAEFGTEYNGLSLIYSKEAIPLGTGGAIRNALPLILSETIMVMNGDSFIIRWDNPELNIWWPVKSPILSLRDQNVL